MIGQTLACPNCGAPLTINPVQLVPLPRPSYSGRTKPCPSCRREMPVEAPSCPHCWYVIDQGPRPLAVEPSAKMPPRHCEPSAEYDPKFVHTAVGIIAHVITLGLAVICYQRVGNWVDAGYMATGPAWLAFLVGLMMCGLAAIQLKLQSAELQERGKHTMFWGQALVFWGFAMGALGGLIARVIGGGTF